MVGPFGDNYDRNARYLFPEQQVQQFTAPVVAVGPAPANAPAVPAQETPAQAAPAPAPPAPLVQGQEDFFDLDFFDEPFEENNDPWRQALESLRPQLTTEIIDAIVRRWPTPGSLIQDLNAAKTDFVAVTAVISRIRIGRTIVGDNPAHAVIQFLVVDPACQALLEHYDEAHLARGRFRFPFRRWLQ